MSDYAGVTPIPDYLNISDWYELVDGDAVPNGWMTVKIYPDENVSIVQQTYGYQQIRSVRSALKNGHRLFTRTPPPSAIKRIRAAETQQEELPAEPTQLDPELQELRAKVVWHTDPKAMLLKLDNLELEMRAISMQLAALIDGL